MKGSKGRMKLSVEEGLALLEKLKGVISEEADSLPECGICLMEMEEADLTVLAKCSHVFCKLCIQQVLSKSGRKCPYCRSSFDECEIVDMAQATKASSEKICEEKPADNIFGTPPKILALLQAIESMKKDEKGVIFSQFTSHLNVIGQAMTAAGHSFLRIDGSVPAPKRISTISSFNSNDAGAPRFILCSLLASGTGINLTRANWCFMMDVWWNEAVESQAMDRSK
jgi:SNF2 family DNA or RNA helicase